MLIRLKERAPFYLVFPRSVEIDGSHEEDVHEGDEGYDNEINAGDDEEGNEGKEGQ